MTQFAKTRYSLIGLGGTFDHFHKGHEFFITYAAELGFSLLIGVTDDKMVHAKKFPETVQSFRTRARQVHAFCKKNNISNEIVKLTDAYGPTIDKYTTVKALCVTTETVAGAAKINQIRGAMNLRELPVFICQMVVDATGQEIHADRIRAGEINRQGELYAQLFAKSLKITGKQKKYLAQPLGKVIAKPAIHDFSHLNQQPSSLPVCIVGDSSLEFFRESKLSFNLGVYDGKKKRLKDLTSSLNQLTPTLTVKNPAGEITPELIAGLQSTLKKGKPAYLFVDGEEDLATVALILLLPLQSLIYYGQPNQGIVEVLVTEQLKEQAYTHLCNP